MVVYNHDIPPELILNLDQIPLSYVSPGKYTFNIKGSSNVPIKGIDDKRQITAIFAVSATGELLPFQLIYAGKTKKCLPKFKFPRSFNVTFTESHWSNTQKAIEHFETVIFPYLNRIKENNGYPGEQKSLVIMDTFRGQDNDDLKKLCAENYCQVVIVPHYLTYKFQPLDLTVNQSAKSFIAEKYNSWFSGEVSKLRMQGQDPCDVKVPLRLTVIKPLHAKWILELYNRLEGGKGLIRNGLVAAGITEAIEDAKSIMRRVENPFKSY